MWNELSFVPFYNKKMEFCIHHLSVGVILVITERLRWQLGRNLVAVASVERWPL